MLKFVYGTKERIFVNTFIGCYSSCSYCYLPSISEKQKYLQISAENAISQVNAMEEYAEGKENTIISLGCYSECMHPDNIEETIKVIRYFCVRNNYIQLATKQNLSEDICRILSSSRLFKDQINIYISMPTYSKIEMLEPGTTSLENRINNINLCKKYGLNVVLYVKPFLENITARDVDCYISLIKKYNIPVVVGGYLTCKETGNPTEVGETLLYEKENSEEMEQFVSTLGEYTDVYMHSTDYINNLRKEKNND